MRYDIVFLRCIAVLSVILFHLKIPMFANGYLGVDIFFVVSGYLMSKIILERNEEGSFQMLSFYTQRAKRIIPPLTIMLMIVFLLIYSFIPLKLYDFARFGFSSVLFVSNIYYHSIQDYFAPSSQLNFLLHTWTLSLEWQFYLVYPLLLLLYDRWLKTRGIPLLLFLTALFLLSLASYLIMSQTNPRFAYYMLPARGWEFISGGLVYVFAAGNKINFSKSVRYWGGIISLSVLMIILLLVPRETASSAKVVLTVASTSLLLCFQSNLILFQFRLPWFLGRISYSLYLWHWPLIVIGTYFGAMGDWRVKIIVLLLSMILGWCSWYFLESRRSSIQLRKLIWVYIVSICILFLGTRIELISKAMNPSTSSLTRYMHDYPRKDAHQQFGFGKTHSTYVHRVTLEDLQARITLNDSVANYLLLGDCHAGMFAATLRELAALHNVNLIQVTVDDTFPAPCSKSAFKGDYALMEYMFKTFIPRNHKKVDKVILSANYADYSKEEIAKLVTDNEHYFKRYRIPIIYIGQTEAYNVEFPVIDYMQRRYGIAEESYLNKDRSLVNKTMRRSSIGVKYLDIYCSNDIIKSDGTKTYLYDTDHFSVFGSEQYKEIFQRKIFGKY